MRIPTHKHKHTHTFTMEATSGVGLRNLTASLKTLEYGVFTVHKIKTAIKPKKKLFKVNSLERVAISSEEQSAAMLKL